MKTHNQILFLSILHLFLQCKKADSDPVNNPDPVNPVEESKLKIAETYLNGCAAKAVVYADKAFEVGYNKVYVALYDSLSGAKLNRGHFHLTPMMNMGSMQHSCPVEDHEDTLALNGYFQGAVVFSMAGTSSQWSLNMRFHNHESNKQGEGSVSFEVKTASPSRFISSSLSLDSNRVVFISLIQPSSPKVGINDFEIVLHEKKSLMDYVSCNRYKVMIEPHMPSMGHGSPNNVDPVHQGEGHYKGKVNYTMTGLWQVKLKLYRDTSLVSADKYFEMTL